MTSSRAPIKDSGYRKAHRLYNKLFGRHPFRERRHHNNPLSECQDIVAVGAVLLEGWISA